ncbi:MAG: insulinase family protein, partial [Betaproteobacteria bacterium]|nr:insulinase family protein [Betaproteobacteria bacterium]
MKPFFTPMLSGILRCWMGFVLVLPLGSALAQTPPDAQQFTLKNGMTLIVKVDKRAPTAVHMLWVRVGSMDEVDGVSGVAHVLEHMLFKGTAKVKQGEFSRKVAALGGRENAFTNKDYTGYYQQIPAKRLPDVMALEADRFANNQWPDEEFSKEIEVVKEERRMRTEDSPRMLMYEQLYATQFVASPYRRPIIGWMNDLDAMTPQDARDFYKRWYVPANAAVVVVGDVDVAEVKRLAETTYGQIPAGIVPTRKPRAEPTQTGTRRVLVKAPADQAYLALSWKVPNFSSFDDTDDNRDALALTLLAAVLDGYNGARLDRALAQGENRLADSAGASNTLSGRGPQVFMLDGVPAKGKTPEQLEVALRAQIANIAKEGVSDAEMRRVKAQWMASNVYQRDSIFNQARELGSSWIEGMPLDSADRLMDRLNTITAAH